MGKKRIIIVCVFILIFIISIIGSMFYQNGKYSVSFETGTNDIFLTKYVSKNGKVSEPVNPTRDGYVFIEWQLNGEKYNFDSEVKSNTVLTAKWAKEEYVTISFDTGTDEVIESRKILEGEVIKDLPVIKREDYEFMGWYLNDKLYNNEEIFDDITLIAKYEKINNIKVGSKVKIIGKYSNSSKSKIAKYSVAIGWEREVLYIFEGREYPYMIGNKNGVTGFFKEESIELVK